MNFVGRDKRLLFKIMEVSVQDLYIEQNFDLKFCVRAVSSGKFDK